MPDFEHLAELEGESTKLKHLKVLLQYLRPLFQRHYNAARSRLSLDHPTVRFEDLWVLMKPGSLAYTEWDGQWLGCIIGESTKLPPELSKGIPQRWSVEYWLLQAHWPSDQIQFAANDVIIDRFEGEQVVTSLPICPVEFQDAKDSGVRRRALIERGLKTCDILWSGSRYMSYEGECLSRSKQRVSLPLVPPYQSC